MSKTPKQTELIPFRFPFLELTIWAKNEEEAREEALKLAIPGTENVTPENEAPTEENLNAESKL